VGRPGTGRWLGAVVAVVQREAHPLDRGLEHGHVEVGAPAGLLALEERGQDAAVGVHAGGDVGHGDPDLGHLLLAAGDGQEAGLALHHQVVGLHRLVGPGHAVAGDVAHDQTGVAGLQLLGAEAGASGRARGQVLEKDVGVAQQLPGDREASGILDVEGERLLVPVRPDEVGAHPGCP
jgi:hypothetical protein